MDNDYVLIEDRTKGGMVGKNTAGGTLQDDRIELTVAGAARSAAPQEISQGAACARTSWCHEQSERWWVSHTALINWFTAPVRRRTV